jgi:hypothetical protein
MTRVITVALSSSVSTGREGGHALPALPSHVHGTTDTHESVLVRTAAARDAPARPPSAVVGTSRSVVLTASPEPADTGQIRWCSSRAERYTRLVSHEEHENLLPNNSLVRSVPASSNDRLWLLCTAGDGGCASAS